MIEGTFLDHLEELRKRILYCLAGIALCSVAGFFFSRPILDFVISVIRLPVAYFFSPAEAFTAQIKVAIFVGIAISFPFLLYQSWAFIGPGLTRTERRVSVSYLAFGILLFIIGLGFGYFILVPYGIKFLLSFATGRLQPIINISRVLSFMFWGLLGTGLLFQLPLVLFFLVRLGLVSVRTLVRRQPEAIVALLVLCAFITPSVDMVTMLVIAAPLILLYELSILVAWLSFRRRKSVPEPAGRP